MRFSVHPCIISIDYYYYFLFYFIYLFIYLFIFVCLFVCFNNIHIRFVLTAMTSQKYWSSPQKSMQVAWHKLIVIT